MRYRNTIWLVLTWNDATPGIALLWNIACNLSMWNKWRLASLHAVYHFNDVSVLLTTSLLQTNSLNTRNDFELFFSFSQGKADKNKTNENNFNLTKKWKMFNHCFRFFVARNKTEIHLKSFSILNLLFTFCHHLTSLTVQYTELNVNMLLAHFPLVSA